MSNVSLRRKRPSRLERFLNGLLHAGKYSLPGVVATLAGCVPPPNLIGVSPDGRYLIVPANDHGVSVALEDDANILRIDLKTQDIVSMGPVQRAAFWMNISGDVIAYGLLRESSCSIAIQRGDQIETIERGIFPALSPDGSKLAYTEIKEGATDITTGRLMLRDIKTGKSVELLAEGVAPEFSPDGKHILYVAKSNDKWAVHVMDDQGKNAKMIAAIDADMEGIFRPRWVDKETIVYRTIDPTTGDDGELFLTDLSGKAQKLTDNELFDALPVFAGKDRVVWHGMPSRDSFGKEMIPLWLSERKDGKWSSKSLEISAFAFNVVGDDIVYATMDQGQKIRLLRSPIADPTKKTDLTELIEKKTQGLPKSTLGQPRR